MGTPVQRYLPTCFYTRMRRSLYKVSSKQTINTSHNNSISPTDTNIDDVLSLKNYKICRVFGIHLSMWTWNKWNKWNNGDCSLLLILGLLSLYWQWKLTTRLYDKQDDFNFPIVNFAFLSSNIPSAPAYGVYVSQLIRYARACSNYQDFMERGKVLTAKLLSQGYQKTKLVATLKKF